VAVASIDITIPVLNEEGCLRRSVTALAARLDAECPYEWSITVIDNGSTDGTWPIADALAAENPRVRAICLDRRGRGRALKRAWATSNADVVAYMDVDLSTGLESLRGLIDPLIAGTADVSIGSRLAHGAQIQRSARREVISRIYNIITRAAFRYSVRDAQCGFKAARREVALSLIPRIEDDGWFFDTELIVLAWRDGLRINEVPVRWVEDDDSRVRIIRTATDDLKGIWRLVRDGRRQRSTSPDKPRVGTIIQVSQNLGSWDSPIWDFDAHAEGYVEAVDQSVSFTGRDSAFFARRKVEILEELARRSAGELSGLSVLDVGCGTGTTDRFLVGHVGTLSGVDVSEEMLVQARQNVPDARYEWYDGEKLPFPDSSFDVSVAICVLHHVPTSARAKFVSELNRVTRHQGLIAIFEHNPLNPLTRYAVNSCDLDAGVVLVHGGGAVTLMKDAGACDVVRGDFLFTPLGGVLGRSFDRALAWLPMGGQYVVSGRARHA
jgi:SAM-dependent methyltransferase/glycosyltransferase involved in cell wall biosynthesis